MRVLLKITGAERYFVSPGEWTTLVADALDFQSFQKVFDYRRAQRIENVEACFCFEDPQYNFQLKL